MGSLHPHPSLNGRGIQRDYSKVKVPRQRPGRKVDEPKRPKQPQPVPQEAQE